MRFLKNFSESFRDHDITISDEDGNLVIEYKKRKFKYEIHVEQGPMDIEVFLNDIKPKQGGFEIDATTKGFIKLNKKVELSKNRYDDIIKQIKFNIDKTGNPPKEITSTPEKSGGRKFILKLID